MSKNVQLNVIGGIPKTFLIAVYNGVTQVLSVLRFTNMDLITITKEYFV